MSNRRPRSGGAPRGAGQRGDRGAGQGQGGGRSGGRGSGPRDSGGNRGGPRGKGAGVRRPGNPPTRRPEKVPSGKRGQVRRSGGASSPGGPGPGGRDAGASAKRTVGGDQVEGRHAVYELLVAGTRKVREIWFSSEVGEASILDDIRELADGKGVNVRDVAKAKFAAQARSEAPQGVLALAAPLPDLDLDDVLEPSRPPGKAGRGGKLRAPFLVALDGVTDPGNLGAVLRSAEGAGVTGAVLPKHRAVNVTPAVTKTAAGAVERVPIALVGGLPNALAQMREHGLWIVGLDGEAEETLYEMPAIDGPVCVVLGAEGRGLSRLVKQRCDLLVRIPLHGQLPSLNVSAAAGLACFEIARHRDAATAG